MNVVMDKNVYYPNEVANVVANINNTSSVDISEMKCRLIQRIELTSNSSHDDRHWQEREICKLKFPGVKAGTTVLKQAQPVPLRSSSYPLYATTRGALVSCEYYILVTCGVFMCPDINLELPIHILARPILYDGWLPTAIVQPTSMVSNEAAPVVVAPTTVTTEDVKDAERSVFREETLQQPLNPPLAPEYK